MTPMKAEMPNEYALWFTSPMGQGVIPDGLKKYSTESEDDTTVDEIEPAIKKRKTGSSENKKLYARKNTNQKLLMKKTQNVKKRKFEDIKKD